MEQSDWFHHEMKVSVDDLCLMLVISCHFSLLLALHADMKSHRVLRKSD